MNVVTHLLARVPYESLRRKKIELPHRRVSDDAEPELLSSRDIPRPY